MRVIEWNVQGAVPPNGKKDRIRNQIEFIESSADLPDLLMLNEVTTVQREMWRNLLTGLGYTDIVDTLDWAAELRDSNVPPHHEMNHVNGNLIAAHETSRAQDLAIKKPSIRFGPWENAGEKDWSTNCPEKILNAELTIDDTTIDLWNVRAVPGSLWGEEKIKILENVYNRIKKSDDKKRILAGDFNTPKDELPDGTVVSWGGDKPDHIQDRWNRAELNILEGLEEFGMVDVFRDVHGSGDIEAVDVSHKTKRFDHMIASQELNPVDCYYDPDGNGEGLSDHSPLITDFEF